MGFLKSRRTRRGGGWIRLGESDTRHRNIIEKMNKLQKRKKCSQELRIRCRLPFQSGST